MEKQVVVFDLNKEHYGVEISIVEGIIKVQAVTRVPHAPSYVEGVTNLRGKVLPVIDMRKRMKIELTETTNDTRIVVVNLGEVKIGMIVDAVSEVLTIPEEIIDPTPSMVTSIDTPFLSGIAKMNDRLVILLDLAKIFSAKEKEALQKM